MALSIDALKDKFKNPDAAELELIARYAMLPENGQRQRAFEAFAETGLPHRRMEAWKWTDFKAALPTVEASKDGASAKALPNEGDAPRSEEHTSELQSPVPISYAVFCLKKKIQIIISPLLYYNIQINLAIFLRCILSIDTH